VTDFSAVATEVFQVLQSFNYRVRLYNEDGMAVAEPADARRFMAHPKNLMVSLVDADDNSRITLSIGKAVVINDVMGLDQKLRTLSTKYNMIFRAQRYGKVINPKNFADLAKITEQEDIAMQVCEGMYGTSRSSYLRLEHARMIVRHSAPINTKTRQRCIESIFVEASDTRRQMPTTDLWAGRAMAQHLNQGGGFADPVGQLIPTLALRERRLLASPDSYAATVATLVEALEPVAEAPRGVEMIRLMGLPVEKQAWYDFWNDYKLNLRHSPDFALRRPNKLDDLAYRVHQIAMVVPEDGLSNLLTRTAEELPNATDAQKRKLFQTIAVHALKAVAKSESQTVQPLAAKNPTVVEHLKWLCSFDPDRVLTEDGWHPMDPSFSTDDHEMAMESAIADFDPDAFADSPEMQDIVSGRSPHDPEENQLTHDEVTQALEAYLRHHVERHSDTYVDDTASMAGAVLTAAIDALHERGFVIDTGELIEGGELTIEDVLLPKDHKGADLGSEVSKSDVVDPADPEHHEKPDQAYASRLMTLAGMRTAF